MCNLTKKLAIYATFFVGFVFLYLSLKGVDYAELARALQSFKVGSIVFSSAIYLSTFILRGLRIRLIFDNKINIKLAISSSLIAYALNNFIPLKGGDIYKIHFLSKQGGSRKAVSTASVMIERLFDLAAVLCIFLAMICLLNLDMISWKITNLIYVILVLTGLLAGMFFLVSKFKYINLEGQLPFVNSDSLQVFMEGWNLLLSHRHFISVMLLSLFIWGTEGFVLYVIIGYKSLSLALLWMSTLALSFVIPNAPGNVGLFEWVSIFVLTRLGYGEEQALSMGMIAHLVQFVSVIIVGMFVYFYYKSRVKVLS